MIITQLLQNYCISETPKNAGGNPKFGLGFSTGNPEKIVDLKYTESLAKYRLSSPYFVCNALHDDKVLIMHFQAAL